MNTEIRDAGRSTIVLEVEITPQELQSAIDEGVRHVARRTRVPGFRPGKAPRPILERALGVDRSDPESPNPIHDEAREHLYERTVIAALEEADRDILELPREPEWTRFEEGVGASYRVTLAVRPEVKLGDYTDYPFKPQVDEVTDTQIDQVVEQLRDQQASLVPVEGRGAQADDFAVIRFEGRRDGAPVEGAQADRFPLIIGKERMIPGFEANLIGMREDEERTFTVTFPEDYGEEELAGQAVEFEVTLLELRERRLPPADDDFAGLVGPYEDLAALREDLRSRMTRQLARSRPPCLRRPHHRVRHGQRHGRAARSHGRSRGRHDGRRAEGPRGTAGHPLRGLPAGHREDEESLREDYREAAEQRVKVLLVLGAIAEREAVDVPDADVEAEIAHLRAEGEASASRVRLSRHRPRPRLHPLAAAPLGAGGIARRPLDRGAPGVRRGPAPAPARMTMMSRPQRTSSGTPSRGDSGGRSR